MAGEVDSQVVGNCGQFEELELSVGIVEKLGCYKQVSLYLLCGKKK